MQGGPRFGSAVARYLLPRSDWDPVVADVICQSMCILLFLALCRPCVVEVRARWHGVSLCLVGRSIHSCRWYFGMLFCGFPACPILVVIVRCGGLSSHLLSPILLLSWNWINCCSLIEVWIWAAGAWTLPMQFHSSPVGLFGFVWYPISERFRSALLFF